MSGFGRPLPIKFDSEVSHAAQEGQFQEDDQREYPHRDERGPTAEAGHRDHHEQGGEGEAKDSQAGEEVMDEATMKGLVPDPWKHRSDGMRCKTCMWFALKDGGPAYASTDPRGAIGRCRRHAPTMGGYPVVFEKDWCGDHKLDENKLVVGKLPNPWTNPMGTGNPAEKTTVEPEYIQMLRRHAADSAVRGQTLASAFSGPQDAAD